MEKLKQSFGGKAELDPRLKWNIQPLRVDFGVTVENRMTVGATEKSDSWKKTYYKPEINEDSANVFGLDWTGDFTAMTRMKVNPMARFDQGGIMIRNGPDNWVKAGLEYVEGKMRLSVVATNGFSDWTTHGHRAATSDLTITVHKKGNQVIVDFGDEEVEKSGTLGMASWWTALINIRTRDPAELRFSRRCELNCPNIDGRSNPNSRSDTFPEPVDDITNVGVYAACPEKAGGTVEFDFLIITKLLRKSFDNDAVLLADA